MQEVSVHIGKQIRLYRKIKGLTMEELAGLIHKTKSTISKYESGEIVMDIGALADVARALDVEIGQLFDFSVLDKKAAEPRGGLAADETFLYFYDGRSSRFTTSLIRINAGSGRTSAVMYFDIASVHEPENCRALYYGTVEYHDILTSYSLINQSNALECVSIYAMNPMENRSRTYGLLLGISTFPLVPVVIKCVFSNQPLTVDAGLKENLMITREDIRMTRAINMFCVHPL